MSWRFVRRNRVSTKTSPNIDTRATCGTSGRFQASYIDTRTGERIVGPHTFKNAHGANNWLVDIHAGLNRGELPDLTLGRTPFNKWAENWLRTRQVAPKTLTRYKTTIKGTLIPYFGKQKINTITRTDVVEMVAALSRDKTSKAHDARRFLSMLLEDAVRSNAIRINPAESVRVRRKPKEEMIFLSREQANAIAIKIAVKEVGRRGGHKIQIELPEYSLLIRLTVETGLRAGELAALRLGRIHTELRRLDIFESVSEVSKDEAPNGLLYGPTKNYERRSVPIPASLAMELEDYLKTRPSDPNALVFTSMDGNPSGTQTSTSGTTSRRYEQRRVFQTKPVSMIYDTLTPPC